MEGYIKNFIAKEQKVLDKLPIKEIAKALNLLQAVYERDSRIYIFGNGGSLAIATHWVSDFNKTVFSHHLDIHPRRFQAIRLPTTEEEITAWANDVGYDMVFVGPLKNYLQDSDIIIAISSSGTSKNVIKAVQFAKKKGNDVIGLSGFDGGGLKRLSDVKIHVPTEVGEYELVEGAHTVILHLVIRYFKDYFDHLVEKKRVRKNYK